jgi:glycosyltransferase involved in cell wall biosynthesis
MPRVSVIVAARDAVATLPQTLASLSAQSYDDWEAVVVDDCSSDGTGQEAAAALGQRVRVLRNDQLLGPAATRNRGVDAARGELIATLDADDLWAPHYLQRQVEAYDSARGEGRQVALVCCDAVLHGPRGPVGERWSDRVRLPTMLTLDELLRENVVYNSVLITRAVFVANGGYRADLVWGEDYDLWLRIVEQGWEIVINPEPLATYRLRTDALSADSARIAAGTRTVYELALARGHLSLRQRSIARRQRRLYALLERRATVAGAREAGHGAALATLRMAPLTARVALEHPERWAGWMRHGPRRAGAGRHTAS